MLSLHHLHNFVLGAFPVVWSLKRFERQHVNRRITADHPCSNYQNQSSGPDGRRKNIKTLALCNGDVKADKEFLDSSEDDGHGLDRNGGAFLSGEQILDNLVNNLSHKKNKSKYKDGRCIR